MVVVGVTATESKVVDARRIWNVDITSAVAKSRSPVVAAAGARLCGRCWGWGWLSQHQKALGRMKGLVDAR